MMQKAGEGKDDDGVEGGLVETAPRRPGCISGVNLRNVP